MAAQPCAGAIVESDADTFLSALAPDGRLTFQTFDDAKRGARFARVMHGSYWQHSAMLAQLNAQGAGVFVMVNRGNGKGRKAADVETVRALFLDLDGAPLHPVMAAPIPPPIVCESSHGKFHTYWPVQGLPLAEFKAAQHALAATYGGDPKVCDLPRVMRLPGFLHCKGEPFRSRLLRCDPVSPWQWPELARALSLPVKDATPETFAIGERNDRLFRFACGLRHQGMARTEALRRVQTANATRCLPPLPSAEVAAIVANAWNGNAQGFVKLPHALTDCEAFRALPDAGKLAVIALCRNFDGRNNGCISLTRREAERWGLDKRRRTVGIEAAIASGLVERAARGLPAMPGRRATPDLFRLLCVPP